MGDGVAEDRMGSGLDNLCSYLESALFRSTVVLLLPLKQVLPLKGHLGHICPAFIDFIVFHHCFLRVVWRHVARGILT